MKIELWPIEKIIPYARNPRRISEAAISKVKASIKEFGIQQPIVVDREGVIIVGHTRYAALQQLEVKEVPVQIADKLTPAQAKSYRIMDNRSHMESSWDDDLLKLELAELDELSIDLELTGFDEGELQVLMAPIFGGPDGSGLTDEDEAPEVQKDVVTWPGDIFVCGSHRIKCGDSTDKNSVRVLTGGECVSAVVTDPPYGINQPGVTNDSPDKLERIINGAVALLPVKDSIVVAFQSTRTFPVWLDAIRKNGHEFERMLWLYKKSQCTFPWRGWILTSESIILSTVGDASWVDVHPYTHDCYELPEVSGELDKTLGWHGSVKPQSVLQDIVQRVSKPRSTVFDGFLGSGSTLIACEKTRRICYGMDIDNSCVDVAIRRWQSFTGKSATLEGDGRTFDEIASERLAKVA